MTYTTIDDEEGGSFIVCNDCGEVGGGHFDTCASIVGGRTFEDWMRYYEEEERQEEQEIGKDEMS